MRCEPTLGFVWMIYTLSVLVALYWTWRFLRSAHIHLRPLPEPTLETPSYTLLIPEGELQPALIPMPESVVHCAEALPHTGWVLALGAGLDVDPSLVRRLAACNAECVSILPQPNSTLMSQVREKFLRNHVDFGRVNAIDEPMGYGDLACCWFFIDPTDSRGHDAPLPAQIARGDPFRLGQLKSDRHAPKMALHWWGRLSERRLNHVALNGSRHGHHACTPIFIPDCVAIHRRDEHRVQGTGRHSIGSRSRESHPDSVA